MKIQRLTRYGAVRIVRTHPAFSGRDARFRRAVLVLLVLNATFLLSCLVQALDR
ncbi:hypothetical protein [Flaviaesturariibacter amylovorans]|uniref:Uncharacterized protein n=1 Tax=Flaviaesturariibacter amylovorans TaxID=1084520 RepID=A0ABP8G5C7_9BACT